MKRRLRTALIMLMIATLPKPAPVHAVCGNTSVDEGGFNGSVDQSVCNFCPTPAPGTPSPGASPSLPSGNSGTQAGGSTAGCSTCGSGSSGIKSSDQGSSAFQLYRIGIPTERSEQSSFGPGIFSQFDSKLQVSPQSAGTSVVFLSVVTMKSYYLVDGLDGESQDGILHDLRNNSVREMKMVNASGATVTSATQATELIATHWTGAKEKFQVIDLNPDPQAVSLAGRLTKQVETTGREVTISYKSWTQAELDASPSRQWQIDTVADSFSNQLAFTYDSAQHGVVDGAYPMSLGMMAPLFRSPMTATI